MDTGFARLTPFSAPPTTRTRGESEKPRSDLATKLTALGGTAKNLARHDSSDSPKAPAPSPQRKVLKREPEERKAGKAVSDSLVAVDRAASYRRVRLEGRGVAAKTDPVFKLEDGEGRSCCQVSVPFDSPESIKVRENLERKLAQATDTKYQVSFKRTLQKTLEIRFVPQLRSQDLDCPEKVIKALLADQSCSRIEAITVWIGGNPGSYHLKWQLEGVDPGSPICRLASACITDHLFERFGWRSEYFENARSRSIGVVASFYPAALGSFSQKHLRQGLGVVVKTVCENINWLAEAGYTSHEISKCGGLADAKITSTEMLAHRKKLPVCHSITMSDADYHDHQMFAKIANLPSDELAHEICRIAQAILLDKLRRKFEVDVNKSTRSKFAKYKISWPDSKIELDGRILIILFSSITHEVRKLLLEGHTPVELAMMKSAELEKNIGATFARRLKNTLGEY